MKTVKGWLIDMLAMEKAIAPPPPEPPKYPCPVRDCNVPPVIIEQDERETTVYCDIYEAKTTYDTTPREEREQQIIRVQDGWRQHGSQPPPPRK